MPINGDRRAIDVAKCTAFPKGTTPRLITDALNDECKAYCLLFNVPVPAEKGQIGKYLKERSSVSSSTVTTENKESIRYYLASGLRDRIAEYFRSKHGVIGDSPWWMRFILSLFQRCTFLLGERVGGFDSVLER
jgi:hypothetical protein